MIKISEKTNRSLQKGNEPDKTHSLTINNNL